MSIDAAWKCLTVKDFINQCNWENLPPKSSVSASSQEIKPQNLLESWQCITTQDFFGLNNWSGQVIFSEHLEQEAITKETFVCDFRYPTVQFWKCFNWLGSPNITPEAKVDKIINDTEEIIAEVEEFTLNNLSQLF
ncbi:MAG: hypothetical protein AAGE84_07560 [Cyanobacteria bacterium P01_G01_bin.39]